MDRRCQIRSFVAIAMIARIVADGPDTPIANRATKLDGRCSWNGSCSPVPAEAEVLTPIAPNNGSVSAPDRGCLSEGLSTHSSQRWT
jgi:hypothetical protein